MTNEPPEPPLAEVTDITAIRTRQRVAEAFEAEYRRNNWYGFVVALARRAIRNEDYVELDRLLRILRVTNEVPDDD